MTILLRPLGDHELQAYSPLASLSQAAIDSGSVPSSSPASGVGLGLEAERRLRGSGYLALRDVSCECQGGQLWLRGRLASYYLKQMAQTLVADLEGARRVVNLIEIVASPRPARQWGASPTGGGPPLAFAEDLDPMTTGQAPPDTHQGVGNDAGPEPQAEPVDHHR